MTFFGAVTVFATNLIEKEPGVIMGPIDAFLGFVLNILFNGIYFITQPIQHTASLGITIILFTFIVRALMIPSGVNMQKGAVIMRRLAPEVDKIKKKYPATKDPEVQRKIQAETQALYAKHKYNPFSGCLPLLITMPIFFALYYLLRQPYMYVDRINVIYERLAMEIMRLPNYIDVVSPIISPHVPAKGIVIDLSLVGDLVKGISKLSSSEWAALTAGLAANGDVGGVTAALATKTNFETFFGLNLLDACSSTLAGLVIPVLSAGTQFLSAFYTYKVNPPTDAQAKSTQMMMMIIMPLFMGYITYTLTMGVGVYWIAGNVFMFAQQVIITRWLMAKERKNGDAEKIKEV